MSARDYRSSASKHSESGKAGPLEQLFYRIYAELSHRKIASHSGRKERLDAKIISVGNISLGGSGKTPLVEHLARHYAIPGIKTGIASGGYGGAAREKGALVSDGKTVKADLASVGDEAIMLAQSLSDVDVPVYVHRNRIAAARELIDIFRCRVVILDDAFHFMSIEKDADILLVNALNPPPGGMLREPSSAMARADCVIITHRDLVDDKSFADTETIIRNNGYTGPVFSSEYLPSRIERTSGNVVESSELSRFKLTPLSGIANPSGFEKSLDKLGLNLGEPIRFDDHYPYSERDAALINKALLEDNANGVITTGKDWVRLEKIARMLTGDIFILHSEVHIQEEFIKWLDEKIRL